MFGSEFWAFANKNPVISLLFVIVFMISIVSLFVGWPTLVRREYKCDCDDEDGE